MNIYKVSCYSKCGTYFAAYLQSVTVIAESKEDAIASTKAWIAQEGQAFIEKDASKWEVDIVHTGLEAGVIDYHEDSDY